MLWLASGPDGDAKVPILLRVLPDVEVREVGELPADLPGAVRVGPYSAARLGEVLRVVPTVGRFLAAGGLRIDMALETGGDRLAIEPLLEGPLAAALILQRGELPLHAAALIPPWGGAAVAIAGDSGAGKSTLAYALMLRGWRLLAEDLTRLQCNTAEIIAFPGRVGVRLSADSCRQFGIDPQTLPPSPGGDGKRLIGSQPMGDTVRLGALFLLDRQGDEGFKPLIRGSAAAAVYRNTHRINYVAPLGVSDAHWSAVAALVTRCAVLSYQSSGTPTETAETLETFARRLHADADGIGKR